MKKWLLRILLVLVAVGALAGAGFAGYRFGLSQGAQLSGNFDNTPRFVERFHKNGIPGLPLGVYPDHRGFDRGIGPAGFHGRGFGLISPFFFLLKVTVLGIIVWGIYKLFTGNGWQLTFSRLPSQTPPAEPVDSTAAKKAGKGKQ